MSRRLVLLSLLLAVAILVIGAGLYFRGRQASPTAEQSEGGWYEVYFTDPKYPDRPDTRRGGLDERFVAFLDVAQRSLDLAIYDFDLANAADALVRAKNRGVNVRIVMDSDTLDDTKDAAIQQAVNKVKQAGIPIVGDNRQPIMHNKFVVRDGNAVWTGSWNFTVGDTYRLNNNAEVFRSEKLAENYTAEFRKMFLDKKFGGNKPAGVPNPQFTINGAQVQNYFAAEDKVAEKIIAQIQKAQRSIRFMAFSFTHDGIGQAVTDRAAAGVSVFGVFERTGSETRFSEFGRMKQAGLDVYQDGNPYVMHHKVFILDETTVITGSFNFSDNADRDNDENLLIVTDPGFARPFLEEFDRGLAAAKNPPAERGRAERERPR
jgi:phosphatidylserine/phosphatidylglycerophosphate/cardiolipin synthase-like enzyme